MKNLYCQSNHTLWTTLIILFSLKKLEYSKNNKNKNILIFNRLIFLTIKNKIFIFKMIIKIIRVKF